MGLRSRQEIERLLNRHVYRFWGKRDFVSIGREEINDLLDHLVKEKGAWTADHVLSIIRKIANWYATRSDTYRSPFVVGMRRTKIRTSASDPASLTKTELGEDDEELKRVWRAAERAGTFGAFVWVLLLTAQRRDKVARMRWDEITPDGIWKIPVKPARRATALR